MESNGTMPGSRPNTSVTSETATFYRRILANKVPPVASEKSPSDDRKSPGTCCLMDEGVRNPATNEAQKMRVRLRRYGLRAFWGSKGKDIMGDDGKSTIILLPQSGYFDILLAAPRNCPSRRFVLPTSDQGGPP
jgi:hypothetical protein